MIEYIKKRDQIIFMTRLIIKKSKLKTNGFLLAEAIFSLVIVILILTILQNILFSIKKINMSENNQGSMITLLRYVN